MEESEMKDLIKRVLENQQKKGDSIESKLEDFVNCSYKTLLGYGLKWQMELIILKDGSMYFNPYHPNYITHYNWKSQFIKGLKESDYINFTYHRGYDPKNIVKWLYKDYLNLIS